MQKLPEQNEFETELVEMLFPHLSQKDKNLIINLFDHMINHPWVDEDVKESMIVNICNEHNIKVPEEYDDSDIDES